MNRKKLIFIIAIICTFLGLAVYYCNSDIYTNNKTTSSDINNNRHIDYTFQEMSPYETTDKCKGFGCVIATLKKPGGKKEVTEKYGNKNIAVIKYHLDKFIDNYDYITYKDLYGMLDCKMSLDESNKLQKETKGKGGYINISGTLRIKERHMYLEPCYFDKVYKCKEDADYFCLADNNILADEDWWENKTTDDIKAEIEDGANINAKTFFNTTPLHIACKKGYTEIVKIFLDNGVEVNVKEKLGEQTPLTYAVKAGNKEIVELLLKNGAYTNIKEPISEYTPLHVATEQHSIEIINLLLDNGANINASSTIGFTALHIAAKKGYKDIVELLLDRGADVNKFDGLSTALMEAADNNYKDIVKLLLEKGADVNAKNEELNFTALSRAQKKEFGEIVTLLKEYGAK